MLVGFPVKMKLKAKRRIADGNEGEKHLRSAKSTKDLEGVITPECNGLGFPQELSSLDGKTFRSHP